jgi:hypothetical protein
VLELGANVREGAVVGDHLGLERFPAVQVVLLSRERVREQRLTDVENQRAPAHDRVRVGARTGEDRMQLVDVRDAQHLDVDLGVCRYERVERRLDVVAEGFRRRLSGDRGAAGVVGADLDRHVARILFSGSVLRLRNQVDWIAGIRPPVGTRPGAGDGVVMATGSRPGSIASMRWNWLLTAGLVPVDQEFFGAAPASAVAPP